MSDTHARKMGMHLKISTQWDLLGISTALLTFVSFFVFMFCGPLQGVNLLLLGFGNPFLMVVYLLFGLTSFICGYVESKKERPDADEAREVIFVEYDR